MCTKRKSRKFISQEEMELLENFDRSLLDKKERFYLDLFLMSFYTGGLSLKDFADLKWEDINGTQLSIKRFKHGRLLYIHSRNSGRTNKENGKGKRRHE